MTLRYLGILIIGVTYKRQVKCFCSSLQYILCESIDLTMQFDRKDVNRGMTHGKKSFLLN